MEDTSTINPANMPTNRQLRGVARETLKGNWLYAVLCTLLYTAVVSVCGSIPLAGLLVVGPLGFGMSIAFLRFVRGETSGEDLVTKPFEVFNHYGRTLGASLLVFLFVMLWSLLLIVPGIVKGLSYAMTPYILHDNPEMSARECIRQSQKMMDGYKMKFFLLQLSFIGWFLLCCITMGIGFLWLQPYIITTEAKFYEELKARQK